MENNDNKNGLTRRNFIQSTAPKNYRNKSYRELHVAGNTKSLKYYQPRDLTGCIYKSFG